MEENFFTITTNREVAEQVERYFSSPVLSEGRQIKLGAIRYEMGTVSEFAVIQIISTKENGKFLPEDIFWLGYWTNRE